MAKQIKIGGQQPPTTEDSPGLVPYLESTSSSENSLEDTNTNNSSYYEPMEPPTTSELTFMPRSPPVVQRLGGNINFNDSSNKTFNGNASIYPIAPTETTTTNAAAGGPAETTFGGPYMDLIPNDMNSTFFGHTLLASQQNNEPPAATRSAASLGTQNFKSTKWSSTESSNGKRYLTNGNYVMVDGGEGAVNDFETPKTSRKRKRHDEHELQNDQSLDILIEPFIAMMRNPILPFGAKMGCATSIEAILNENPMKSVKILAQEDFLNEIGKVLEIAIANPYSGTNAQTILKILERISCLSPEAKTLVQTCCFQALKNLGSRANLVDKANELLGQLRQN